MENSETLVIKVIDQQGITAAVLMAKCQEDDKRITEFLSSCCTIRREEIQVRSVRDVFKSLFYWLNGHEHNEWDGKIFYFNPEEFIRYPLLKIKQMIDRIEESKAKEIIKDEMISSLVATVNSLRERIRLLERWTSLSNL